MRAALRLLRPAANQTNSPVWQDPVYGYYEQHGKMRFKPNEEYGISEAEKQAVLHRYRIKEILKKEYLRREYDPHHYNYKHAIVMCPAMFRWYAMNRTHAETFRYTPRSIFLLMAVGGIVTVYIVKALFQIKSDSDRECFTGERLWWDRLTERKLFISGHGEYHASTTYV